jgi:hypothetical protein
MACAIGSPTGADLLREPNVPVLAVIAPFAIVVEVVITDDVS